MSRPFIKNTSTRLDDCCLFVRLHTKDQGPHNNKYRYTISINARKPQFFKWSFIDKEIPI